MPNVQIGVYTGFMKWIGISWRYNLPKLTWDVHSIVDDILTKGVMEL